MTPTDLSAKAGISVPYASQLLSDKPEMRRDPPLEMACHIYRKAGLKLGPLAKLSDEEAGTLAELQERAA